jgi:hypothetical protein
LLAKREPGGQFHIREEACFSPNHPIQDKT